MGEGAIRFSHSGYRFILGFGTDFFGIWDREAPGGPSMRYPRSDQGWAEAWNRFTALEPRAMAIEATAGPAPGVQPTDRRATGALSKWLVGLFAGLILSTVVEAGFVMRRITLFQRVRATPGSVSSSEANAADAGVGAMASIAGLVGLAIVVLWLIWQYRSHKNLRSFGLTGLRYSPGWVVGFWLIPFALPVMPYLTMRELWQASEPGAGAADWKMVRTTPLLPAWWLVFLTPIVLSVIGIGISGQEPNSLSSALTTNYLSLAALLLNAIGAGLAIVLVRRIESRMTAKGARISSWTATPSFAG